MKNQITLDRHPSGRGENVISIKCELVATITQEKPGLHVSYCPALDLYSQGKTREEARENLIEATHLFIESCLERNTLSEALTECGFDRIIRPARKKKAKPAPRLAGAPWKVKIPAELPVLAC
ncbi:MAG: type II toxin-antitoxin system HicB family antitoxin [Alphaproteobacteria bacterium]|nr:type II toxin-antitoxin system HicB family antitoxin [Alphaproteobacteria bacterium]